MHRHEHDHAVVRAGQRGALLLSLVINAAFLVVEVAGGLAFHSLALLADAAHMFTDVAALTLAYAGMALSDRAPTRRHTSMSTTPSVMGTMRRPKKPRTRSTEDADRPPRGQHHQPGRLLIP